MARFRLFIVTAVALYFLKPILTAPRWSALRQLFLAVPALSTDDVRDRAIRGLLSRR
jgi:hypothetical protein